MCVPLTPNTLTFALFKHIRRHKYDTANSAQWSPSFPRAEAAMQRKKASRHLCAMPQPHSQGRSNSLCLLLPQCWCWGHYSSKIRDRSRSVCYVAGPSGAPQPHHLRAPVCTGVSCAAATLNGTWPSTVAGCFSIISTQMWMSSYLHFPLISELERGRLVTTQGFPQDTRQC